MNYSCLLKDNKSFNEVTRNGLLILIRSIHIKQDLSKTKSLPITFRAMSLK